MRKTLRRTVTVGTTILLTLAIVLIAGAPSTASNGYTVDGMDGIITLRDTLGNQMTVKADCARVIADNTPNLEELHRDGTTTLPEYVDKCFDPPKES